MISFKQLESGAPKDIEVRTDDADAEMADIEDALKEGEFEEAVTWGNFHAAERGDGGHGDFVFVIPGDEAGEIADFYEPLQDALQGFMAKTLSEAENA